MELKIKFDKEHVVHEENVLKMPANFDTAFDS